MATPEPPASMPRAGAPVRHYRYYDLVMAGFVTVLLCSNLIGPGKTVALDLGVNILAVKDGHFAWTTILAFGAGNIFFPISYIFDDVLTEVYGYARSRRVIWAGFGAMFFATVMEQAIIRLPPDPSEPFNKAMQPAIETVFGNGWRIILGSMLAFWVGDFLNSYVLAKMKVLTKGRFLWMRTIGSTIIGEGADTLLFYPIAFAGIWKADTLWTLMIFNWGFKVMVEVVLTPVTYLVVNFLKRAEREDYYDVGTDFNPFTLRD